MIKAILVFGLFILTAFNIQQPNLLTESVKRGETIYEDFCVVCHMAKGEGVPGAFPPLAGSDYLLNNRKGSIHAVKYGQEGELVVNDITYNNIMTPLYLTDEEVADVMNYILNSWGNKGEFVSVEEVKSVKKE
jgi:mono/diheme cytochrome c family protein